MHISGGDAFIEPAQQPNLNRESVSCREIPSFPWVNQSEPIMVIVTTRGRCMVCCIETMRLTGRRSGWACADKLLSQLTPVKIGWRRFKGLELELELFLLPQDLAQTDWGDLLNHINSPQLFFFFLIINHSIQKNRCRLRLDDVTSLLGSKVYMFDRDNVTS
jgi:hypothetical protein